MTRSTDYRSRSTNPKLRLSSILLALISLAGCQQAPPDATDFLPAAEAAGAPVAKAARRGESLEGLLDQLPSDMRENLCHNQLRRERANSWLKQNLVGQTFEDEVEVLEARVDKLSQEKYWVRMWLADSEREILGEHLLYCVGPWFTADPLLFARGFMATDEVIHAMIFQTAKKRPGRILIETNDAQVAEALADLQGKAANLKGLIDSFEFYPVDPTGNCGGLMISLKDATFAGHPVKRIPLSEEPKNPWSIPWEPLPTMHDARAYFASCKLDGGATDANANAWSQFTSTGNPSSPDGDWQGRWNTTKSPNWQLTENPVSIVVQGDLMYFRTVGKEETTLAVMKEIEKGVYVGRYVGDKSAIFPSPIAVRVVSPERIDGYWTDVRGTEGRWDFQRKLVAGDPQSSLAN